LTAPEPPATGQDVRPIVYLGPSLTVPEAAALCPGADLRPPIERGTLSRDWNGGARDFLILDGLFFGRQAVSPREVIDVIGAGAMVIGAASMGALRAAECWPIGMRGSGVIYRLFRSGKLTSDDEVAVSFDPAAPHRTSSVALVNVRYAAARALRRGWLDRSVALDLVGAAQGLFYSDRTWEAILDAVPNVPRDRVAALVSTDLKANDARRALRLFSQLTQSQRPVSQRVRQLASSTPVDPDRERSPDATAGLDTARVKVAFARWQLLSGRYARHGLALLGTELDPGMTARMNVQMRSAQMLAELGAGDEGTGTAAEQSNEGDPRSMTLPTALLARELVLLAAWREFMEREQPFAESMWQELLFRDELDAEMWRWRATNAAVQFGRRTGLRPGERHRFIARTEMANAHGFAEWTELASASSGVAYPWSAFVECAEELAMARLVRERLFEPGSSTPWPPELLCDLEGVPLIP
jgi:hypothetical protein